MKKFKKIFAVLLTLAMVLGMSMTSFAANLTDGSFTVTGLKPDNEAIVSYAQILKQDESGNWKFTDAADGKLSWNDGSGMTVESLTGANVPLQNLDGLAGLTYGNEKTAVGGAVTFDNLPAGLYAVKALDTNNQYVYSYMIAKIDYDNGKLVGSKLTAKVQENIPEKTPSTTSVVPGEVVTFTVKVNYPTFATGSTEKRMEIVDTVTNGKIVEDSVTISDEFAGLFGTPSVTNEGTKLTISLNADAYDSSKAGQQVVITYNVKADDGIYNAVENRVISKVPTQDGTDTANQAIVKLPNVSAEITKVDEKDAVITSSTATFELYKADENGTATIKVYDKSNPEGTEIKATLVDTQKTENGKVTFTGLEPNAEKATYYVKETVAPNGYAVEPLARKLTGATLAGNTGTPVNNNGVWTTTTEYTATNFNELEGFEDTNFVNTKLGSLPSTGGIGTTIFTIGGCAIMIIAAALFFASRRKSSK